MSSTHPLPSNITGSLQEDRKYLYYTIAMIGALITFLLLKTGLLYATLFAISFFGLFALFTNGKQLIFTAKYDKKTSDKAENISVKTDHTSFVIGLDHYKVIRLISRCKGIVSHSERELLSVRTDSMLRTINGSAMFVLTAVPYPTDAEDGKSRIEMFVLRNTVFFRCYLIVKSNGTSDEFNSISDSIRAAGFDPSAVTEEEIHNLVIDKRLESPAGWASRSERIKYRHFTRKGDMFMTSRKFLDFSGIENNLWPFLTSLNIPFRVKTSLTRLGQEQTGKILRRATAEYGAMIKLNLNRSGKVPRLYALKKDTDRLLSALNSGSPIFGCEVTLESFATHPAKLRLADETLLRNMNAIMGISVSGISRRSKYGCTLSVNVSHDYPVDSASATDLIHVPENMERFTGVMAGIDVVNSKPFFIDIFSGESYNVTVLGQTGSGKSFFIKLLIRRMLEKGIAKKVIIFDPLSEYKPEMFQGMINSARLEIEFVDLANLNSSEKWMHNTGSDNERSNSSHSEDLASCRITIIRNLEEGEGESGLLKFKGSLQNWMGERVDERKILLIDEAHVILRTVTGREVLDDIVRHSRHFNTSVILASQNLEDFLKGSVNRSVLSNSRHLFVFRNSESGKSSIRTLVGEGFEIPDISLLPGGKNSAYSECIYSGDGVRRIRVIASTDEASALN